MNAKAYVGLNCVTVLVAVLAPGVSLFAQNNSPRPHLTVLYAFTGDADGASPNEVTRDSSGNLYGTAAYGGNLIACGSGGCGVVFKIDSRGRETVLYTFTGPDGSNPYAGLLRDNAGRLYGNTTAGGANFTGTVFQLEPRARCCGAACWTEAVLHNFGAYGGADGVTPYADFVRDTQGNLYGTTSYGGGAIGCAVAGCGTVFKVDPQGNYTTIYSFTGPPADGLYAVAPLLLAADGSLYGTTAQGGASNAGTVFKLTAAGSGWIESVLYSFTGGADGGTPYAGLVLDERGNLYGTTYAGAVGNGVVFELRPTSSGWAEKVIHTFAGAPDGASPAARLLRDGFGNLYGTTVGGGRTSDCRFGSSGCGTVFKLSPNGSGWTETILWRFTGAADGSSPYGPVVMDERGNLYGAAYNGGGPNLRNAACAGLGCGTIFELIP
jgi:uncharacterized repeat protein (TIGR03803 family)